MSRFLAVAFCVFTWVGCLAAQGQVASVSSEGTFSLRGATIFPDKGIPSWPVMRDDMVISGDMPVTVTFPDGSTVILDWGSKAQIRMSGQTPVFELESGSATYSLKSLTAVNLIAQNQTISLKGLTGRVGFDVARKAVVVGSGKVSGIGLGIHPILWGISIGAAAGLGYAVYRGTSGGVSVSPSD